MSPEKNRLRNEIAFIVPGAALLSPEKIVAADVECHSFIRHATDLARERVAVRRERARHVNANEALATQPRLHRLRQRLRSQRLCDVVKERVRGGRRSEKLCPPLPR